MKIVKIPFYLLFKLYYLVVFSLIFLLLLPFFLIGFHVYKNNLYIYRLHRIWAKLLNVFTLIKLDLTNKNLQLPKGPFIIISNHTSFLDVFLMCLIFPHHPLVFMAKAELMKIPLFGILFKYYHIPVYRNDRKKAASSIESSEQRIDMGLSIVLFPEGGIFNELIPQPAPFKNGAFRMAKDKQVPIVPITFLNNFRLVGEPSEFFSVARPGVAKAIVHPVITVAEINELSLQALKEKSYQTIVQPLKEKYKF